MAKKAMTLRIPTEQAAELEAVSRVENQSVSETVREAIDLLIAERRKDTEFRDRIRKTMEEDKKILDRLAS